MLQTKQLLADTQVLMRANDYKIDDTSENLRMVTEKLSRLTESVKQQTQSLPPTKTLRVVDKDVTKAGPRFGENRLICCGRSLSAMTGRGTLNRVVRI